MLSQSTQQQNLKPQQLLPVETLKSLNQRSNVKGILQLMAHLMVMGVSGYLWGSQVLEGWLAVPFLVIYGFSLASMFATLHECVHRTAFASQRFNDLVAWWAGVLSLYNSTYYRPYHKWHHRYTQIPGKDPELAEAKPSNWREYLLHLSGLPWWWGKLQTYWELITGQLDNYYFIKENNREAIIRSARLQILVYGSAIALTTALGHPEAFFLYWLLPLAVGQPILRFILLAEHTGCTYDDNPLTNTRTTLTVFPIRLLMWNMPYHSEHHLYPSLPFHALPKAHQQLAPYFQQIENGYLKVNQNLVQQF
ncbi:fatty acid desaturase [Euhalothece natronophila Z-M001]|uniref:Fatty acid desaturase n=2 Tax=Euhalothece TaxID=65097 RepID=A0A5B8NR64_9CHRO|nr:fatty acid desaturase [Euhalothece natronophila Z-M001]